MTDSKITAPFTTEQIDALNRFQRAGYVHPFTCPGHPGEGDRNLVATKDGWICCHCDYGQDWAHASMLDLPPHPLQDVEAIVSPEDLEAFTEIALRVDALRIESRIDAAKARGLETVAMGVLLATTVVRAMRRAADEIDRLAKPKSEALDLQPGAGEESTAFLIGWLRGYASRLREIGERNVKHHYVEIAKSGEERLLEAKMIGRAGELLAATEAKRGSGAFEPGDISTFLAGGDKQK